MTTRQRGISVPRLGQMLLIAAAICGTQGGALAATFSSQVFATGSAVGATAPDSVTYGGGSVWVEYGNGASSTDYSGNGTIVQYSMVGAIQNTYTLGGSVDGLKYNPNSGLVWALQNQDANSQLSTINPLTKAITTYNYGAPYPSISGSRGFDDVAFIGNNVYLSLTNPASGSDPVIVKLNSATPSSPISFSTVLVQGSLLVTDPDSLKSTPTGGLVQTGEADKALTFINNPGAANQTATSLKLMASAGTTIGSPDDSIYPTATSGTFYLTDTTANTVYALSATGLSTDSLFVNVGNEFGSVDPVTGVVTPIFTGTGLHGIEFVPAAPTPEPASLGFSFAGLALGAAALIRKQSSK